ncbi:MAG: hypothetical protein HDT32_03565 [Clostridiales bacterium]|nr:hypothetical protein [Clostridiales bacterium]
MLLGFFTEDAYDRLLSSVDENREKYLLTDNWVPTCFNKGVEWYGISSQQVNKFSPYYSMAKDKSEDDFVNARNLYEAFKITPLQATNKYMWAYMCHMDEECRKYMRYRWSDSSPEQRYFVPGDGMMGLYYFNGLSRLWWWAHLTYDPNCKDPYHLTNILFENQMLGKDLLDTLNRANFKRMKGILLAIQDFREIIGPKKGINDYFRKCKKELNHYAAISSFDYLDSEDIRDITLKKLIEVSK